MKTLILLAICIATSEACSCLPYPSLQDYICSSDFVSRVKVISKKDPNNGYSNGYQDITYTVKHVKVYKKPPSVKELPNQILTASNSAACGIELTIGEEYLLGGSVDEQGKLRSYLCGIFQKWSSVSKDDRKTLRRYQCSSPTTVPSYG
ncbi:unnamed protein product [Cylicocyclus nassatus]|uniref:NTR domain-containing protein n=1 Tax=Cylicocyclus nassatus TaxID=53992 RepID=A0AA36GY41_CYLNA|nr:unnamed protein product [Cylicocyclus nassatus]